jgi:hypothetical protein
VQNGRAEFIVVGNDDGPTDLCPHFDESKPPCSLHPGAATIAGIHGDECAVCTAHVAAFVGDVLQDEAVFERASPSDETKALPTSPTLCVFESIGSAPPSPT